MLLTYRVFLRLFFPWRRIKVLVTAKFSKGKLFPHKISALLARRILVPNTVLDYFILTETQNRVSPTSSNTEQTVRAVVHSKVLYNN